MKIYLEEGEVICSKCNGKGKIYFISELISYPCLKCLGKGKVDWVTNITWTGEYAVSSSSMSSSTSSVSSSSIKRKVL